MKTKNLRILILLTCCSIVLAARPGDVVAQLPFENDGNLYVAMYNSDSYHIFTKSGELSGTLTAPGLNGPRGLAFNPANGDIWVTGEFSNTIHVFDNQHRLLRTLTHPDFNQPVGVSFKMMRGVPTGDQEVYVSNSGTGAGSAGNNIMVFDQQGNLLRSFNRNGLVDPNCTAFFPDGSFYVSNRLGSVDDNGNTDGILGRVDKFDENDNFLFSFNAPGMASVMAVARDPNGPGDLDDTIWVTSGGGARGIYEFDQSGNLLRTILPTDLATFGVSGAAMIPQGIAFDDNGNMTVVSWTGGVYQFDGDGNLLNSYDPDPSILATPGKSRSMAFEYQNTQSVLLGDVDVNGVVNFLDISPFIAALSIGAYLAEADVNQDGAVNFLDISSFIAILSS